jgi:hypothetical protein
MIIKDLFQRTFSFLFISLFLSLEAQAGCVFSNPPKVGSVELTEVYPNAEVQSPPRRRAKQYGRWYSRDGSRNEKSYFPAPWTKFGVEKYSILVKAQQNRNECYVLTMTIQLASETSELSKTELLRIKRKIVNLVPVKPPAEIFDSIVDKDGSRYLTVIISLDFGLGNGQSVNNLRMNFANLVAAYFCRMHPPMPSALSPGVIWWAQMDPVKIDRIVWPLIESARFEMVRQRGGRPELKRRAPALRTSSPKICRRQAQIRAYVGANHDFFPLPDILEIPSD